jgi:hypothetical protein
MCIVTLSCTAQEKNPILRLPSEFQPDVTPPTNASFSSPRPDRNQHLLPIHEGQPQQPKK